ncbi:MAG: hypothetical protein EBS89_04205 [Proteobacteria bacterium]|nr:hypothetical protein [Pseudomonadota bacterium]
MIANARTKSCTPLLPVIAPTCKNVKDSDGTPLVLRHASRSSSVEGRNVPQSTPCGMTVTRSGSAPASRRPSRDHRDGVTIWVSVRATALAKGSPRAISDVGT